MLSPNNPQGQNFRLPLNSDIMYAEFKVIHVSYAKRHKSMVLNGHIYKHTTDGTQTRGESLEMFLSWWNSGSLMSNRT